VDGWWTDGEYGWICEITRVHEFPTNAHVRAPATSAEFGSKLIRNQQVIGSSPIADYTFFRISQHFGAARPRREILTP
jgi:hypothetical protein